MYARFGASPRSRLAAARPRGRQDIFKVKILRLLFCSRGASTFSGGFQNDVRAGTVGVWKRDPPLLSSSLSCNGRTHCRRVLFPLPDRTAECFGQDGSGCLLFIHRSGFPPFFPQLHVFHLFAAVALQPFANKGRIFLELPFFPVFGRSQAMARKMFFGKNFENFSALQTNNFITICF